MSGRAREQTDSTEQRRKLLRELLVLALVIITGAALGILHQQGTLAIEPIDAALRFVAELFLRLLKMIVVPLVVATMVTGVASVGIEELRSLSARAIGWYLLTTSLAVTLGLAAVNLVKPGVGISLERAASPEIEVDSFGQLVLAMIPENPFAALADSSALLSVIVFSLLVGVAIVAVGEPAQPLRRVFGALEAVMMKITAWVLWLTPLGILGLIYRVAAETEPAEFLRVGTYFFTVLGALLAHALVTIPLLVMLIVRVNPRHLFRAMAPALLTAFSTASSSATLPLTLECVEERAGVADRVSGFVLPLGATVNMDGTAMYEAVAVLFIAQAYGMDLSVGQQVLVFVTATLAGIGAAGVPSAGLVTMVIVLQAVGLPLEGVGLLLAVDRVLDMVRTSVNVWGDASGAVVVAHQVDALDRSRLVGD